MPNYLYYPKNNFNGIVNDDADYVIYINGCNYFTQWIIPGTIRA